MNNTILLLPILIPLAAGILTLFTAKLKGAKEGMALAATACNLLIAAALFKGALTYSMPWAGFGLEFLLRSYPFSNFIILATAAFGFLITLYTSAFLRGKSFAAQFYAYLLITISFVNGAVLADNLVLLLFFWEGLLLTTFGMIAIGNPQAFKTATKAFVIMGVADLCMMAGIAIAGHLAGTLTISEISIRATGVGGLAFVFLMIGAIAKAGSMPFHSWIPDAAIDAPLPFMAIVPGAIEKLVGIYFLTRISLDMFSLQPHTWMSFTLMTIGSITILLAVMMALIQKDFKKLLSYHAISQVGYMLLGIGTALPVGIIGGLFHMINNALYKSCLFLTGGATELQAGTTDLRKLGGLGSKMPVTFACFIITALAISGVPPFNGFFSKELVYDGALERGAVFYFAAVIGSFFTAASFLKLGHAAFLGALNKEHERVKEAPLRMLIPMLILAVTCILFGIYNSFPINNLIVPSLGKYMLEGHTFSGFHANPILVIITVVVLLGALLNHIYGVKRTGSGLKAVDHIHYAPGLSSIYAKAEKRRFDPYDRGLAVVKMLSGAALLVDRAIDWLYEVFSVRAAYAASGVVRRLHSGSYRTYIFWSITAAAIVLLYFLR